MHYKVASGEVCLVTQDPKVVRDSVMAMERIKFRKDFFLVSANHALDKISRIHVVLYFRAMLFKCCSYF